MRIREYRPSDKKKVFILVSEILGCIFNGEPAKFEYLKEFRITKDYILYLVAETMGREKKIMGTMALKKIDRETARLKRMYIHPDYRGRGLAQKMLNKVLAFAKKENYKKILFSSYPIMENARRFNKRNGFIEIKGNPKEQIHLVKYL